MCILHKWLTLLKMELLLIRLKQVILQIQAKIIITADIKNSMSYLYFKLQSNLGVSLIDQKKLHTEETIWKTKKNNQQELTVEESRKEVKENN